MSIEEVQAEKEAEKVEEKPVETTEPSTEEKDVLEELDKADEEIQEQIEVFEPVALAIERKFTHPEDGEEKVFIQKELAFLSKTKFFRLLSGTIRLASEDQQQTMTDFLSDITGGNPLSSLTEEEESEQFIGLILRIVELVPDFIESLYVLSCNVKPVDELWFREALETIDDEYGFDILEAFVAQNGKAIRRFFDQHLRKIAKRFSQEISEG